MIYPGYYFHVHFKIMCILLFWYGLFFRYPLSHWSDVSFKACFLIHPDFLYGWIIQTKNLSEVLKSLTLIILPSIYPIQIFRCSYVRCIYAYECYIFFLDWCLYHYIILFIFWYRLCFKVYFVWYNKSAFLSLQVHCLNHSAMTTNFPFHFQRIWFLKINNLCTTFQGWGWGRNVCCMK